MSGSGERSEGKVCLKTFCATNKSHSPNENIWVEFKFLVGSFSREENTFIAMEKKRICVGKWKKIVLVEREKRSAWDVLCHELIHASNENSLEVGFQWYPFSYIFFPRFCFLMDNSLHLCFQLILLLLLLVLYIFVFSMATTFSNFSITIHLIFFLYKID